MSEPADCPRSQAIPLPRRLSRSRARRAVSRARSLRACGRPATRVLRGRVDVLATRVLHGHVDVLATGVLRGRATFWRSEHASSQAIAVKTHRGAGGRATSSLELKSSSPERA